MKIDLNCCDRNGKNVCLRSFETVDVVNFWNHSNRVGGIQLSSGEKFYCLERQSQIYTMLTLVAIEDQKAARIS